MTDDVVPSQTSWFGGYGAISILLGILLAAPIWSVAHPPLVDYPNHLARGYILYHLDEVPSFAAHYESHYLTTPSLAMDGFMLALQPVWEVRTVGKLFLTLTVWLWLLGWHLLGAAIHGRHTWLALGGTLAGYHSMFLYGFTNFSFGLGMFLCAAAAWGYWRSAWSWSRLLLMAVLALGSYFSHMAAYLFLFGTALAVTSWEAFRHRKITGPMLLGIVPLLAPIGFFFRGGGSGAGVVWNTLQGKLVGALCLFRGYDRTIDAAFLGAVAVFLGLAFFWSVRLRATGGPLFAGLGCVGMFLIGPQEIFGGAPADARFLPPASALILLSLDAAWPRGKALVLLAIFLGLALFRIGMIAFWWHAFDADLSAQATLFEHFPREARVYPIVAVERDPDRQKLDLASFHFLCDAVLTRQIYTPHLLAYAGQQPIRYRTPPIQFHDNPERYPTLSPADWDKVFAHYDYLWCRQVPEGDLAFLLRHCEVVTRRNGATILRINKNK